MCLQISKDTCGDNLIVEPVVDKAMRGLCCRPYPGHPKGCPNFKKKEGCPPSAPMIDETLDLSKPVHAVFNVFDLARHVKRMKNKHPHWSDRQLKCCLYWQPRARKQLREKIMRFLYEHPGETVVKCPEAQGVNLTETMKNAGIELEWPPENVTYQIVLIGTRLVKETEA